MPKKLTPEEYRKYFEEHYPDYELLSDYLGSTEYIHVRCKIDGYEWDTKPIWLKAGAGCKKCYYRRSAEIRRKEETKFIQQSKEKHGDIFDYSKVNYRGNKIPVILICPKHGEFPVRPDKHLSRGDGCPECSKIKNGLKRRLPQNEFIRRSSEVHNKKYDYSKTVYEGWDKPVTIICPEHGEFVQQAGSHLLGAGCPVCSESHLEKKLAGILTDAGISFSRQKRFKWLGRMSLDFFLTDLNIAVECQGLQHYSNYYFNKWDYCSSLERIIERDVKKNTLCEKNGIHVLYYSKSKDIFNASPIYTNENTFTSFDELISFLKKCGPEQKVELTEHDLKAIISNIVGKIIK